MLRFSLSLAALALLLASDCALQAQTVHADFVEAPLTGSFGSLTQSATTRTTIEVRMPQLRIKQTGLLTSRLARKELQRWKNLERLVLTTDKQGVPLLPTLHALWQWAERSGHVIYVQMEEDTAATSSTAGSFALERLDPSGKSHVAVLKLFLTNIDQALSGPQVARANGFIPFAELRKEERYAEVLSHELAHAQYVLSSLLRSYLVQDLIQTTNDLLLEQARRRTSLFTSLDLKVRISQRDTLLKELEDQAEGIEETVWQELLASQTSRVPPRFAHRIGK